MSWLNKQLIIKYGLVALSIIIIIYSGYNIINIFSSISLKDVLASVKLIEFQAIAASIFFAAISYLCLIGYDYTALKQANARTSLSLMTLASFSSYCICFNLGFPVVTGPAIRYWIYSRENVTPQQIVYVTSIISITFLLGLVMLLSIGMIMGAHDLANFYHYHPAWNIFIGVSIFVLIIMFLGWNSIKPRSINVRGYELTLPTNFFIVLQLLLGGVEQAFASASLYQLIPHTPDINFYSFSVIYIFACTVGIISHSPGGLGVFEAAMMQALPINAPQVILAGLLLFRIVYYLLPFVITLVLLFNDQKSRQWSGLRIALSNILTLHK